MKLASLILMMCVVVSTAGCATTSRCDWGKPIRPSVDDVLTDGTAAQILTHNETGAKLCRWTP